MIARHVSIKVQALTACALIAFSISTSAVAFRDVDSFIGADGRGRLVNQYNPLSGVFSIVSPSEGNSVTIRSGYGSESGKTYSDVAGFRPLTDLAYNASAYFYVRDDKDSAAEVVNVKLDGLQFDKEYFYSETSILGGNLWLANATLLILLNLDGTLKYTVTAPGSNNDFYLEYARLEVDAFVRPSAPTRVPDAGSTAGLLIIGAVLLAGFARFSKSAA